MENDRAVVTLVSGVLATIEKSGRTLAVRLDGVKLVDLAEVAA